jgi:hypothetical protein
MKKNGNLSPINMYKLQKHWKNFEEILHLKAYTESVARIVSLFISENLT